MVRGLGSHVMCFNFTLNVIGKKALSIFMQNGWFSKINTGSKITGNRLWENTAWFIIIIINFDPDPKVTTYFFTGASCWQGDFSSLLSLKTWSISSVSAWRDSLRLIPPSSPSLSWVQGLNLILPHIRYHQMPICYEYLSLRQCPLLILLTSLILADIYFVVIYTEVSDCSRYYFQNTYSTLLLEMEIFSN